MCSAIRYDEGRMFPDFATNRFHLFLCMVVLVNVISTCKRLNLVFSAVHSAGNHRPRCFGYFPPCLKSNKHPHCSKSNIIRSDPRSRTKDHSHPNSSSIYAVTIAPRMNHTQCCRLQTSLSLILPFSDPGHSYRFICVTVIACLHVSSEREGQAPLSRNA